MLYKQSSACMKQFLEELQIYDKYQQWMSCLGKVPKEWINLLPKAIKVREGRDYGRLIVLDKALTNKKTLLGTVLFELYWVDLANKEDCPKMPRYKYELVAWVCKAKKWTRSRANKLNKIALKQMWLEIEYNKYRRQK